MYPHSIKLFQRMASRQRPYKFNPGTTNEGQSRISLPQGMSFKQCISRGLLATRRQLYVLVIIRICCASSRSQERRCQLNQVLFFQFFHGRFSYSTLGARSISNRWWYRPLSDLEQSPHWWWVCKMQDILQKYILRYAPELGTHKTWDG